MKSNNQRLAKKDRVLGKTCGATWKGQETAAEALAEDQTRSKLMRKEAGRTIDLNICQRRHIRMSVRLAAMLGKDTDTRTRTTLASMCTMLEVRQSIITALLSLASPLADHELRTATIINSNWRVPIGRLLSADAASIKAQFRTHLQRIGAFKEDGFLVGFIHGESDGRYFQLHFHLLATANRASVLHSLKGRWGYVRTRSRAPPLRVMPMRDRPEQFSYLLKSFWLEKLIRPTSRGKKRSRKGRRIKGWAHSEYLLWLHRTELADMMIVSGATYRNGQFYSK